MPLFSFGKKEQQPMGMPQGNPQGVPGGGNPIPVERVVAMRSQGLSNNQIVQTLQREGYDSAQIFDALSQADLRSGAPVQGYAPQPEMAQPEAQQQYDQGFNQQQPGYGGGSDRERIEEMAETIIDEKWDELIKNINKIIEWKDRTEQKITRMEQEMKDMKDNFEKLHMALIGKISEYDQNILNVGTEIKAMEHVFQKILPAFTENVSELSRITKNIKKTTPTKP